MTQISSFKRFSREDYTKAQTWFHDFLDNLNPTIDSLNVLLFGGVDIDFNLKAERQIQTVQHGVPLTLHMATANLIPALVRVGYAQGYVGQGGITAFNADGSVQVTVYFQGAPTGSISTMLIFEP